jgi:enoyl-CoA hydratase/carnithine racemase
MEYISKEDRDQVVILKLAHDDTNPLNAELIQELAEELRRVKTNPEVSGLVLGSANDKFFSIGFDIPNLYELSRSDFAVFYHAFNSFCLELYTFPKPTVAAITGHAVAGGCILALCCDYRFIADGRKLMGLNEIKLGMPVPYPADRILRQIIGHRCARDVLESGEFYNPNKLLQFGMVDEILPLGQVIPMSIEKARSLGDLPQGAYAAIKQNRVEIVEAQIKARMDEKEALFLDYWYSQESRSLLKDAIEKF